jgi:hypothetical protein
MIERRLNNSGGKLHFFRKEHCMFRGMLYML